MLTHQSIQWPRQARTAALLYGTPSASLPPFFLKCGKPIAVKNHQDFPIFSFSLGLGPGRDPASATNNAQTVRLRSGRYLSPTTYICFVLQRQGATRDWQQRRNSSIRTEKTSYELHLTNIRVQIGWEATKSGSLNRQDSRAFHPLVLG